MTIVYIYMQVLNQAVIVFSFENRDKDVRYGLLGMISFPGKICSSFTKKDNAIQLVYDKKFHILF